MARSSINWIDLETVALEIVKTFGIKFFLGQTSSIVECIQRGALRVIRALNEYGTDYSKGPDFGKKAFDVADGSKVLSDVLHGLLQCITIDSHSK